MAEDDVPIPYVERTRDYYLALGYGTPYRWAHFVEVPFTSLRTPLSRARVDVYSGGGIAPTRSTMRR